MKYINLRGKAFTSLIFAVLITLITACASGPQVVSHAFSFDAIWDSPDVEILDYKYGDDYVMTRAPEWQKEQGTVSQGGTVDGAMPRGDSLFVKWRLKATGEEFQDTVDLRRRLPTDIKDKKIHFVIKGKQLYVYLISSERRRENEPKNGPDRFDYLKVITIYPGQPQF